jgi:quinol monooxygenase YgiN
MKYAFVSHKVKDYNAWRPYYDEDEPRRAEAGIKDLMVFRDQDDPNSITMYWQVDDPEKVQEMSQSPELQDLMKQAGVLSEPKMRFYEEA